MGKSLQQFYMNERVTSAVAIWRRVISRTIKPIVSNCNIPSPRYDSFWPTHQHKIPKYGNLTTVS